MLSCQTVPSGKNMVQCFWLLLAYGLFWKGWGKYVTEQTCANPLFQG